VVVLESYRELVAHKDHHLRMTTRAFLSFMGLRDLADLPPLTSQANEVPA